ncbi:MAG: hypothetical protein U1E76_05930 [Planctomycetota bacterium]
MWPSIPAMLTLYLVLGFLLGVVLARCCRSAAAIRRAWSRTCAPLVARGRRAARVHGAGEELGLLPRSGRRLGSWYQLLAERRAKHVAAALW